MSQRPANPRAAAVIVAAGKGLRAGRNTPKQFAMWRGKPLLRHSVEAMSAAGLNPIIVVIPVDAHDIAAKALSGLDGFSLISGGETRQQSVAKGLEALQAAAPDNVLIHDAARPGLTQEMLDRMIDALRDQKAAVPVLPVVDSLLHAEDGRMGEPAVRDALRRVQTPQAFHYQAILQAHRDWLGPEIAGDDAQVARRAGIDVALIEGDEALHKITFAGDFGDTMPAIRVGTGYDVHRFGDRRELWLCGVRIEHDRGLEGHSDADVAIHALVDALLGAIGAGDIGQHFPPADPQWRNARSELFLAYAADLVAKAGYAIGNADVTIICEAPRIANHRQAMLIRLAEILGVDIGVLSVKATTTEGLGFTGRSEGIAAHAVVSLVRN